MWEEFRDIVADNETGLLVTALDVSGVGNKTFRSPGDKGLRDRVGSKIRRLVGDTPAWYSILDRCCEVLAAVEGKP